MSRSGYDYDYDYDPLEQGRYIARLNSATRGKRGQAFLKAMLEALDAMPVKKLYPLVLVNDELDKVYHEEFIGDAVVIVPGIPMGGVCAMGSLAKARAIDTSNVDPEEPEDVASLFNVATPLVREIAYNNDEGGFYLDETGRRTRKETPEERFTRMRKYIESLIKKEAAAL